MVRGNLSLLVVESCLSFRTVRRSERQTKPSCDRARRSPTCDCRCGERHSESVVVLHAVPTTYSPVRRGANLRKKGMGNLTRRDGEKTNWHTCAGTSANRKQPYNFSSELKRTS